MIEAYYEITKPGIIYGNLLAAAAGFLFASGGYVDWRLFIATLFGLALVIGSACTFNNVYDRKMDARMERTKRRPTVTGRIPAKRALVYAFVLGFAGALMLALYANALALIWAFVGFFVYVLLYTPLKPKNPVALFVGAIAGATPPVVGYVAVTGSFDSYAALFFALMFVWQIPHFLAIATYRWHEYTAAGVPLYIKKEPSAKAKRRGRVIFYASLVVLLGACVLLMLQR
jgi:protoheme IX farnesyltransferase